MLANYISSYVAMIFAKERTGNGLNNIMAKGTAKS